MVKITVSFKLETELTGIEIQFLETMMMDEYGTDNVVVTQKEVKENGNSS